MTLQDITYIFTWWGMFFLFGIAFLPLTLTLFKTFRDGGYIFSKILGIGLVAYVVFLLAILKIFPFSLTSIAITIVLFLLFNVYIFKTKNVISVLRKAAPFVVLQEMLFFACLVFWAYVRSHEPSINGLEKFMDFGFINSILKSTYLPPTDIWFPPNPINYYYFGHFVAALLTKLSQISSNISYNLILSTIFALTFVASFSIGLNLFMARVNKLRSGVIAGTLSALLVTLAGNLHTLYAFFTPYVPAEKPVLFWELRFLPLTLFSNGYWYPNATRFIPNTIHEFPLYSFVVADLHGHVFDIPFVLLSIALLMSFSFQKVINITRVLLLCLLLAIMYMTNAWDGAIYMLLSFGTIFYITFSQTKIVNIKQFFSNFSKLKIPLSNLLQYTTILIIGFVVFSLPFNLNFKPFVSGIGVLCAPQFLIKLKSFGPFLFEANHCARSPFWMLLVLYGFFYVFVFIFLIFLYKNKAERKQKSSLFTILLISLSSLLIIIPEFIYVKDIYPQHYRANTMFKLVYQSFIMLSICSGFIITYVIKKINNIALYIPTAILLTIVLIYPWFAIFSYYGNFKNYSGLDGTLYLKDKLPQDYQTINFINKNIKGQVVILEAAGDSYTDYERISANTGQPTVLGWLVHEWLWRGSYDVPAPRIEEVKQIYESKDLAQTKSLLKKYNVSYIYIGNLEREKYLQLNKEKFENLGQVVFISGYSKLYKVSGP